MCLPESTVRQLSDKCVNLDQASPPTKRTGNYFAAGSSSGTAAASARMHLPRKWLSRSEMGSRPTSSQAILIVAQLGCPPIPRQRFDAPASIARVALSKISCRRDSLQPCLDRVFQTQRYLYVSISGSHLGVVAIPPTCNCCTALTALRRCFVANGLQPGASSIEKR
jgi:hypothetical protein